MFGMAIAIAVLVVVLIGGAFVTTIYNHLVLLKNGCDNGFSQIDVQLKRRHDLIPNLVQCVKSYMRHEGATLENVIQARNQAVNQLAKAGQDPGNRQAVQAWQASESVLTGALGRLSMVMESYPELKAQETVATLTEELTSTENRIAFARQVYNDAVTGFNTYRECFPGVMVAGMCGFNENRPLIDFDEAEAPNDAPAVCLT